MDLALIKQYLRIDYDDDDNLLNELMLSAQIYLENAICDYKNLKSENDEKIKILELAIVQDLYDNRGLKMGSTYTPNPTITTLINQFDILGAVK